LKVIQITPSIGQEDSGPSYSVQRLFDELLKLKIDAELATLDLKLDANFKKAKTYTFPCNYHPRLGHSKLMNTWLEARLKSCKSLVIHNHGMWQSNAIYSSRLKSKYNHRLLISPRGTLSDWALNNGSVIAKKIFWSLFQRNALQVADCIHVTSISEYEDVRRLGFKNPIAIIPNGIDTSVFSKPPKKDKTVLFLGRIHKKKGIEMLLNAWKRLNNKYPDWALKIVGSDEDYYGRKGYKDFLLNMVRSCNIKGVVFSDPLFGDKKNQEYRRSSVFILPTYSENFGMTVIESLAQETPAIVTYGAPWKDLETYNAGWWIPISEDAIFNALDEALKIGQDELLSMGKNGFRLVEKAYSWPSITKDMLNVYSWINGDINNRPSCVMID